MFQCVWQDFSLTKIFSGTQGIEEYNWHSTSMALDTWTWRMIQGVSFIILWISWLTLSTTFIPGCRMENNVKWTEWNQDSLVRPWTLRENKIEIIYCYWMFFPFMYHLLYVCLIQRFYMQRTMQIPYRLH